LETLNIDLFESDDKLTKDLKQILAENNLTNAIKEHTRITDSSKTIINLAITSTQQKSLKMVPIGQAYQITILSLLLLTCFESAT